MVGQKYTTLKIFLSNSEAPRCFLAIPSLLEGRNWLPPSLSISIEAYMGLFYIKFPNHCVFTSLSLHHGLLGWVWWEASCLNVPLHRGHLREWDNIFHAWCFLGFLDKRMIDHRALCASQPWQYISVIIFFSRSMKNFEHLEFHQIFDG